jgi:release factor glutamine methyltransferase
MSDPRAPRTIRGLLDVTKDWLAKRGIESARLDAELLLGHALKLKRIQLYTDLDRPLIEAEVVAYRELIKRRGNHEPVAYLIGEREFWGLPLVVTKDVLIPRPDTETLVEQALELLPADAAGVVVDVCTGSGCIGLALAHERPHVNVVATELSQGALAVARQNAERTKLVERFEVREGDLLAPCVELRGVLLVVANPPYIRLDEKAGLMPDVRDHEPHLALFGEGAEGLAHHARILEQALPLLAPEACVLLEIGAGQRDAALGLPHDGYDAPTFRSDLGGNTRTVCWRARPLQ